MISQRVVNKRFTSGGKALSVVTLLLKQETFFLPSLWCESTPAPRPQTHIWSRNKLRLQWCPGGLDECSFHWKELWGAFPAEGSPALSWSKSAWEQAALRSPRARTSLPRGALADTLLCGNQHLWPTTQGLLASAHKGGATAGYILSSMNYYQPDTPKSSSTLLPVLRPINKYTKGANFESSWSTPVLYHLLYSVKHFPQLQYSRVRRDPERSFPIFSHIGSCKRSREMKGHAPGPVVSEQHRKDPTPFPALCLEVLPQLPGRDNSSRCVARATCSGHLGPNEVQTPRSQFRVTGSASRRGGILWPAFKTSLARDSEHTDGEEALKEILRISPGLCPSLAQAQA